MYARNCQFAKFHAKQGPQCTLLSRKFTTSSFSDVTKYRNAALPFANGTDFGVNVLNLFSHLREIVEQSLEHLFITSSTVVLVSQ